MKRNAPVMIVALLLVGLAGYQMFQTRQESRAAISNTPELARNKPAPAFTLQGLDGKTYQVGGARNKPLIVNFWASWCGPCREEAPDLKRMYEQFGDKIDIYGVNVSKDDSLKDAKGFVQQYSLPFPILIDEKGKTAEMYRILFIPTSFLIDKEGLLQDVIHVLPPDLLEKRIQWLINK